MHIVNFNRDKYRSADEAARHPEGLAVLSILFKLSKEDNPQLEPIVRVLERVKDPGRVHLAPNIRLFSAFSEIFAET